MKKIIRFSKKNAGLITVFIFWLAFVLIYSYKLLQFPIFEDEAELLYFAEKILYNPIKNIFISMRYGPLPALSWLVTIVSVVVNDTLIGGRILNVLLASSILYWFYLIAKYYDLSKRFIVYSSLIYIFSPILLLNSRLALWDTSVMVFSAWYIYLFLLAWKKTKSSTYILTFIVFTVSLLIKFTSLFALPAVLFLLAVKFYRTRNSKIFYRSLILILFSFLILILFIYYFRSSVIGDAGVSLVTNNSFKDVIPKIHTNIWLYLNWVKVYFSYYPLLLISLIYVFYEIKKKKYLEIIPSLFIWFFVSSATMILFNRFYYPRHILILLVPIVVIIVYSMLNIPLYLSSIFVALIIATNVFLFKDILFNCRNANIAKEDRFEYFENYTSGINIGNISESLSGLTKDKKIVVWLDGTWIMEYGLRHALKDNKNILFESFVIYDSWKPGVPGNVSKNTFGDNYVIVNNREPFNIKTLTLVKEFSWNNHKRQYLYQFK